MKVEITDVSESEMITFLERLFDSTQLTGEQVDRINKNLYWVDVPLEIAAGNSPSEYLVYER